MAGGWLNREVVKAGCDKHNKNVHTFKKHKSHKCMILSELLDTHIRILDNNMCFLVLLENELTEIMSRLCTRTNENIFDRFRMLVYRLNCIKSKM